MIGVAKLYAAPVALLLWALLWALGVQGDSVIVGGLTLTAGGLILNAQENTRRQQQ